MIVIQFCWGRLANSDNRKKVRQQNIYLLFNSDPHRQKHKQNGQTKTVKTPEKAIYSKLTGQQPTHKHSVTTQKTTLKTELRNTVHNAIS